MAHFMSQYCVSGDFMFHSGGFGSKGLMNRLSRALHLTGLNPLRMSQFHISLLMDSYDARAASRVRHFY
jgi:hypothetical protein